MPAAIERVVASGKTLTADLVGTARTNDVGSIV
jgi:hypothetical protein